MAIPVEEGAFPEGVREGVELLDVLVLLGLLRAVDRPHHLLGELKD